MNLCHIFNQDSLPPNEKQEVDDDLSAYVPNLLPILSTLPRLVVIYLLKVEYAFFKWHVIWQDSPIKGHVTIWWEPFKLSL